MYQSLHSTILRHGQMVEIQIRTDWMHAVAEMGLASHWLYKDQQRAESASTLTSSTNSHYRTAWLTCLKDWQNEWSLEAKDFVEAVRAEILGRRVSFFLKNGRIHDLPRGATLLDAGFKLHKQIGLHLRLAEVNGLPVSCLDYVVQNGDVLYVVATRNARPSPSWVTAAHCRTTRGKIRTYFRSKEPGVAEMEGRRLVEDILERNRELLEWKLGAVPTAEDLETAVRSHTGYASLQEVYFQVALSVEHHETGAMLGRVLGLDAEAVQRLDLSTLTEVSHLQRGLGEEDERVYGIEGGLYEGGGGGGGEGHAHTHVKVEVEGENDKRKEGREEGGGGSEKKKKDLRMGPRGEQEQILILSHNGRETYRLCACCRPVDGDPLVGLKTWEPVLGEVIVVHRGDQVCGELVAEEKTAAGEGGEGGMVAAAAAAGAAGAGAVVSSSSPPPPSLKHPKRVEVNSDRFNLDDDEGYFPVSVEILARRQRLYVLSNLVTSLESAEAMLLDAALGSSRSEGGGDEESHHTDDLEEEEEDEDMVLRFHFLVGVHSLEHLQRVLGGLRNVGGVIHAKRSE